MESTDTEISPTNRVFLRFSSCMDVKIGNKLIAIRFFLLVQVDRVEIMVVCLYPTHVKVKKNSFAKRLIQPQQMGVKLHLQ